LGHLLDSLFRFPSDRTPEGNCLRQVLEMIDLPVLVVDRRFRFRMMNKDAEETLARRGLKIRDRSKKNPYRAFKALIQPYILDCLNENRAQIIPPVPPPGSSDFSLRTVVCPGQVEGKPLAFVIGIPGLYGAVDEDVALEKILESFKAGVFVLDADLKHRFFNERALAIFRLARGEAVGKRTSDINPSAQAKVLDQQFAAMIESRTFRIEDGYPVASAKLGVIRCRACAWPVWNADGVAQGLVLIVDPLEPQVIAYVPDRRSLEMLGAEGYLHGPPMFYTHLDGKIFLASSAAKSLIAQDVVGRPANLRTDIRWVHPEVIEGLYEGFMRGGEFSTVMAEIETPEGRKPMRIVAHGTKDIGDIVARVFFVMTDMSQHEGPRRMLAEMVKNLATENEVLDRALDALDMPIGLFDADLRVVRINRAVGRRLGIDPAKVVGKDISEVVPTAGTSGLAALLKKAIDEWQDIHIPRFEHVMKDGAVMPMEGAIHPLRVQGKPCCMAVVRELGELGKLQAEVARWAGLYNAVTSNLHEAIFVQDRDGTITDVNKVGLETRGGKVKVIGTYADGHLAPEAGRDIILEAKRRAIASGKTVKTGRVRIKRLPTEEELIVEITDVPLYDTKGDFDGLVTVVNYLTGVVRLEKEVSAYTENLERMVAEWAREAAKAHDVVATVTNKLASVPQWDAILGASGDRTVVLSAFLDKVRHTLDADFVDLIMIEEREGVKHRTYHTAGDAPPAGAVPADVVENLLSRRAQGASQSCTATNVIPNVMVTDFDVSGTAGLLVAWKAAGEFAPIHQVLARILCTQLAYMLPVSQHVSELKNRREKAECLRRIAVRVAGATSFEAALRSSVQEAATCVKADRFFWLTCGQGEEMWLSEIYGKVRRVEGTRRFALPGSLTAGEIKAAVAGRGRLLSRAGAKIAESEKKQGVVEARTCEGCTLGGREWAGELPRKIKDWFEESEIVPRGTGMLVTAPVSLSEDSWGLLCAYSGNERGVTSDDGCFLCVASSMIGNVWRAADAASALRRLEAAGETVSSIVHDLKYPVNSIRARLAEATRSAGPAGEAKGALASVRVELDKISLLTDELTEVSNPRNHSPEIIAVNDIVEYCVSLLAGDLAEKSIEVINEIGAVAPIFADKRDVTRVLLNILSNGVEAVASNGRLKLSARLMEPRPGVRLVGLVFEDSGPGVPSGDLAKVFEAFYTTKKDGTGLGLFSAKKRALANGGDVICEVGASGKSQFVASFPVAVA